MSAIQGDDSEEGRARRSKIQLQLDEANGELQDTERERYISDQQNMLDNLYTEYEDLMNNLFKDQNKLLRDGINYINSNHAEMKAVLDEYANTYGYAYSDNFRDVATSFNTASGNVVTSMRNALNSEDSESIAKVLEAQGNKIVAAYEGTKPTTNSNNKEAAIQKGINESKNASDYSSKAGIHSYVNKSGSPVANNSTYNKMKSGISEQGKKNAKVYDALNDLTFGFNTAKYWNDNEKNKTPSSKVNKWIQKQKTYSKSYNSKGKVVYRYLNEAGLKELAKKLGVSYGKDSKHKTKEIADYFKAAGISGFRKGGIARLVKSKGEDGLAMVRNGEGFIPPENVAQIQDLMRIVPDITAFTKKLTKLPTIPTPNQPTNTFGDIHFDSIELPNVQNVDDFVTALQTDKKVQHALEIGVHDLMNKGKISSNIQRIR